MGEVGGGYHSRYKPEASQKPHAVVTFSFSSSFLLFASAKVNCGLSTF